MGGPWDFTSKNGRFAGKNPGGSVPQRKALFFALYSGHNKYEISNNYIYNLYEGVREGFFGTPPASKGFTEITGNTIIGKTNDNGSESISIGIYVSDATGSGYAASNGKIQIEGNTITGARLGINPVSVQQRLFVNGNTISAFHYPYAVDNMVTGIWVDKAFGLEELKHNSVTGTGYHCSKANSPLLAGYLIDSVGRSTALSNISCNLAQDIYYGMQFKRKSYINLRGNELRRNTNGLYFGERAIIGQQGDVCDPTDNRWTGDACTSSCGSCDDFPGWHVSTVYATYTELANPTLSKIYVRDSDTYDPVVLYQGNNGGPAAYSYPSTLIYASTGCTAGMPDPMDCEAAERPAGNGKALANIAATSTMQLFRRKRSDRVI